MPIYLYKSVRNANISLHIVRWHESKYYIPIPTTCYRSLVSLIGGRLSQPSTIKPRASKDIFFSFCRLPRDRRRDPHRPPATSTQRERRSTRRALAMTPGLRGSYRPPRQQRRAGWRYVNAFLLRQEALRAQRPVGPVRHHHRPGRAASDGGRRSLGRRYAALLFIQLGLSKLSMYSLWLPYSACRWNFVRWNSYLFSVFFNVENICFVLLILRGRRNVGFWDIPGIKQNERHPLRGTD